MANRYGSTPMAAKPMKTAAAPKAAPKMAGTHPHKNLGAWLHPKKG